MASASSGDDAGFFFDRSKKAEKGLEELEAKLYQQIGQLKVELDWLKKISVAPVEKKT